MFWSCALIAKHHALAKGEIWRWKYKTKRTTFKLFANTHHWVLSHEPSSLSSLMFLLQKATAMINYIQEKTFNRANIASANLKYDDRLISPALLLHSKYPGMTLWHYISFSCLKWQLKWKRSISDGSTATFAHAGKCCLKVSVQNTAGCRNQDSGQGVGFALLKKETWLLKDQNTSCNGFRVEVKVGGPRPKKWNCDSEGPWVGCLQQFPCVFPLQRQIGCLCLLSVDHSWLNRARGRSVQSTGLDPTGSPSPCIQNWVLVVLLPFQLKAVREIANGKFCIHEAEKYCNNWVILCDLHWFPSICILLNLWYKFIAEKFAWRFFSRRESCDLILKLI